MSVGVPLDASGRVDLKRTQVEAASSLRSLKGADFSTRLARNDLTLPVRVGAVLLERIRRELTSRDALIVVLVAEHRLVSAAQIRRLVFPVSDFATPETAARSCRRVLKRLVRDRLLHRLERRVGGVRAGSDGFVYALGPVGWQLVDAEGRSRPRRLEPTLPFVDHHLAISELVVELRLADRRGDVQLLSLQGEPRCWRPLPGQRAVAGLLRPDLQVALRRGHIELSWFVEVDRGTAHLPTLLRKCAMYETYYRSGVEQATRGVFPRVLWVTPSSRRETRLRQAVERSRSLTKPLFQVTTADAAPDVLLGAEGLR